MVRVCVLCLSFVFVVCTFCVLYFALCFVCLVCLFGDVFSLL
jgi:hypothetical protein